MLLPEKQESESIPEKKADKRTIEDCFSRYEITVLFFSLLMVITTLIFAAWSWILLLTGDIQGGGPLGLLMKLLPINLLLR
ncbi:MAG TPA: hypothetical protein VJ969_09965 [Desulfopila sp.]|nr:hypothetical protein [Desulfopila sp.]